MDSLAEQGIAFVPYFPLGGFTPLQSSALDAVAARLGRDPAVGRAGLAAPALPEHPADPGTSSRAHLRENVAGAGVELPADAVAELDAIGS